MTGRSAWRLRIYRDRVGPCLNRVLEFFGGGVAKIPVKESGGIERQHGLGHKKNEVTSWV